MAKKSNKIPFPQLPRLRQLKISYCGPAVLAMLLKFQGVTTDQEKIVKATGVALKIKERGMTIAELALATKRLTPHLQFWFKRYATLDELSQLVNLYHYPVGVEWQGVFTYENKQEKSDDDPGHYSVVTKINRQQNYLLLADPFKDYAGQDRRFRLLTFERRWWDINQVIDPKTQRRHQVDDYHALFIITPQKEIFPKKFKMKRG